MAGTRLHSTPSSTGPGSTRADRTTRAPPRPSSTHTARSAAGGRACAASGSGRGGQAAQVAGQGAEAAAGGHQGGGLVVGVAAVLEGGQGGQHGLEVVGQRGEGGDQGGVGPAAGEDGAGVEVGGQLLEAAAEAARPVGAHPGRLGGGVGGRPGPAHAGRGHGDPVEVGGVVGQPVGLVDHDHVDLGQHHPGGVGHRPQLQLEQEQVVVGHDHVDVAGLLPGPLGEAALVEGAALLPRAVLAAGRDQVPDVVADPGRGVQPAPGRRVGRPHGHLEGRLLGGRGGQLGRPHQGLHAGVAGVVGPAHGQGRGGAEGVGQAGQVALDQLGLEGLGGGGHDRPPPGGHDRDQVAERLADPRGGVDQQRDLLLEGLGDGGGHAPLGRPLGQAGQRVEGGLEVHGANLTGDRDIAAAPPTGRARRPWDA